MSDTIATYSFLPWLRQGLANQIGGATVDDRAAISVPLQLHGKGAGGPDLNLTVTRNVALYGPGDVTGLEQRAVFRTEPLHWTTNFEPNYLAAIDFYDEDLPWRYTPAAPDGNGRLQPWLALVVLEEQEEFAEGKDVRDKPLPYIEVPNPALFPPASQLWATAHVHVNRGLAGDIVSTDADAIATSFRAVLNENPDLAYSRILCPRRLQPNKAYHAFLIPAFESGRRAGLGLDPFANPALPAITTEAWATYGGRPEGTRYPVYYRWYFRTGGEGDFESLVRMLEPREADPRVGMRDIDVQHPGENVRGVEGGVLPLGGALRVPDTPESDWANPYPQPIQQDLAKLINLADDYQAAGSSDDDPVITPPLYGTWHALTKRLLHERNGSAVANDTNWVHELNLDPRFRVAAGLGTRVVQDQQERFMNAAWEQLGKVLEANRRIRAGHLALAAATMWHERHLATLHGAARQKALMVMAPVNRRVVIGPATVQQHLRESVLQPVITSPALRRAIRSRGRLARRLFDEKTPVGELLDRVNQGEASAAPPKVVPPGVQTIDDVSRATEHPYPTDDRESIDRLPDDPEFTLGDPFRPDDPPRERDGKEASRYKQALQDHVILIRASRDAGRTEPKRQLDLEGLGKEILRALEPQRTIPVRIMRTVNLPARVRAEIGNDFVEAMAYPEIDVPMYEPLRNLGSELLLPNINLVPPNNITLLETNQKFIEAYMAGLNHEFARELLWREYPTDQRGSYFRQFWDVSSYLDTDGLDEAALKEKLRDITRLDHWALASRLGDHNNRVMSDGGKATVVLVIRGELLKRYPNAAIYAHRATWQLTGGVIDKTRERLPAALTAGEAAMPPRTKIRTPLYEAKVEPDIYFFGFDLTVEEAQGEHPKDDPGWFFVIKERPGEPRFGLDVEQSTPLGSWNDLSWDDADVSTGAGQFLQVPGTKSFPFTPPAMGDPERAQWDEDRMVPWNNAISSADLAYILFRVPVLVAVHASELLPS